LDSQVRPRTGLRRPGSRPLCANPDAQDQPPGGDLVLSGDCVGYDHRGARGQQPGLLGLPVLVDQQPLWGAREQDLRGTFARFGWVSRRSRGRPGTLSPEDALTERRPARGCPCEPQRRFTRIITAVSGFRMSRHRGVRSRPSGGATRPARRPEQTAHKGSVALEDGDIHEHSRTAASIL
jgi:hypothetical protein